MANLFVSPRNSPALSGRICALFFVVLALLVPGSVRAQRVVLQTRIAAAGADFVDAGMVPGSQPVTVTVRLRPSADRIAALEQRLADQLDPASAEYHRWMTPAEFGASFGATDAQVASATAWMQGQTLRVTAVSAARTTLTVSGSAAQVQAAFDVSLRVLRRGAGVFFANAGQPSVPAEAASVIAGVSGLDDLPPAISVDGGGSDPVGTTAAALEANDGPVLTLTSTACAEDVAAGDVETWTALLRQANAQGMTVLARGACGSGAGGFPASLVEVTAVALPGDGASRLGIYPDVRPAWQAAPGLPEDGVRHAPDLTASSLGALSETIGSLVRKAGTRSGNINAVLYRLGPTPGLYTQADGAPAGTWEAATGLGMIDLTKLLTVFPRGTGASFTSIGSSNYSPMHGTSITLTSSVSSGTGGGAPTGTIAFVTSAGVTLGTAPLVSGTATFSIATLPGGSTTIAANYSGDGTYAASVSPTTSVYVQAEASALSAVVSSGSTVGGTYTVVVTDTAASGVGVPAGTITVNLSGTGTNYTGALMAAGPSSSMATITIPAAVVGTATLSINCSGDSTYSCNNPLTKTVTIGKAMPGLVLAYTPNPPVSGQTISFTASLAAVGTAPVPTGNVSFFDGTTTINAGRLVNGTVTVSGTDITVAMHSISATYDGDANYLTVTVTGATAAGMIATTTALTSSSPVANGASITFTAVVTAASAGASAPGGTVGFYDGTVLLGMSVVASGSATYATASLDTTAVHSITAVYSGDSLYKGSTSGAVLVQSETGSSTAVTGTVAATILPVSAAYNSAAVVTAVVTIPGGAVLPGGSLVSAQIMGLTGTYTAKLVVATSTTATAAIMVPVPVPGMYTVVVGCVATTAFVCGNAPSLALTATAGGSVTTLALTPALAVAGQTITLTAMVGPAPASTPLTVSATGLVTFYDAGVSIGTGMLAAGTARLVAVVSAGTAHLYTATYAGDTNYLTSTSSGTRLSGATATPAIMVSSNAASTLAGLNVVLTAHVAGVASTPTGTVSFYDTFSGAPLLLGTAALGGNGSGTATATLASTGLQDGTHTIYALYAGDANYLTATSASITVAVVDYNVGFAPASLSIVQGASGSVTVPVTLVGAFKGTITFACTPPAATETTCTLTPAVLNGAGQTTLTITTTAPAAQSALSGGRILARFASGTALALLVFFGVPGRRRRGSLLMLGVAIGLTANLGCGDSTTAGSQPGVNTGSPLGTTFFTITAAGSDGVNTIRHTYQFQVTIR